MFRKNFLVGFALLASVALLSVSTAKAVTPGTPAANAALNFDPFNPSSAANEAPAATTKVAGSSAVAVQSAATTPATNPNPTSFQLSCQDAPPVTRSPSVIVYAQFPITLYQASNFTVITCHYATANGNAIAGTDYQSTSGTATFYEGQTLVTVPVAVYPGTNKTPLKFFLNISNPVNATIIRPQGTATIKPPPAH